MNLHILVVVAGSEGGGKSSSPQKRNIEMFLKMVGFIEVSTIYNSKQTHKVVLVK